MLLMKLGKNNRINFMKRNHLVYVPFQENLVINSPSSRYRHLSWLSLHNSYWNIILNRIFFLVDALSVPVGSAVDNRRILKEILNKQIQDPEAFLQTTGHEMKYLFPNMTQKISHNQGKDWQEKSSGITLTDFTKFLLTSFCFLI